jgi:hypothetical protein
MTKEEKPDGPELTPEELDEQSAHAIPDRASMAIVDANVAIPIDPAIAADVLAGEDVPEEEPAERAEPEEGTDGEEG